MAKRITKQQAEALAKEIANKLVPGHNAECERQRKRRDIIINDILAENPLLKEFCESNANVLFYAESFLIKKYPDLFVEVGNTNNRSVWEYERKIMNRILVLSISYTDLEEIENIVSSDFYYNRL